MLVINGKKFAASDSEFVASLFETGFTCVGYYKANKRSICLMDHQRKHVGTINRWGVLCKATKQDDGRTWYNHADIDIVGRVESCPDWHDWLGVNSISHTYESGEYQYKFA